MIIERLKERLTALNADFEIIKHDKPIKSKKDAMGYFNIDETIPTLIIETEQGFYALIVSGVRDKVDFESLKQQLRVQKVKITDKNELLSRFNLESGKVPLIGHDLPCIVDTKIFEYPYVFGGTGDFYHTLKIKPDDLVRANTVLLTFY